MVVKITKEALRQMEIAVAAKQDAANPFVREGETTFMRNDEIRVRQEAGAALVEFYWRGMLTYTMVIRCNLAAGEMLTLTGIEGRMVVRAQ